MSMLIYIITFAISLSFMHIATKRRENYLIFSFLAMIIPILLAGFRDNTVGVDSSGYPTSVFYAARHSTSWKTYFLSVSVLAKDILYVLLAKVVSLFSNSLNVYFGVCHFLICGCVMAAISKMPMKCRVLGWSIFLFCFFNVTLNAARQCIAMSLDVFALSQFMSNSKKQAFVIALLAVGFHNTAVIFIFILLFYGYIFKHTKVVDTLKMKICIVVIAIGFMLFFKQIAVAFASYEIVNQEYIGRYISDNKYGINFPISLCALYLFNLLTYFRCKKYIVAHRSVTGKVIPIFTFYMILFSIMTLGLGQISTYLVRIGWYFAYINIILMPILLYKYNSSRFNRIAMICFCMFYYIMITYYRDLESVLPYKSRIVGI